MIGVAGNSAGFGIDLVNSTSMSLAGASNTLVADSMNLATPAGAINAGANGLALFPQTAGTAIDLGGADAAGTLGLTDAELDCISAGTIWVESFGSLTISDNITRAAPTTLILLAPGDIVFDADGTPGSVNNPGGGVGLAAYDGGTIVSGGAATDITAADLGLEADFAGIGAADNP